MINDIFIVGKYTFREIIKSKVLYNIVLLGLGLLFICYLAYSFTYGVPDRIALDFGLGTLTLSSAGMALFMGVGLMSKEIESRTLYMVLSRPISRSSFFLGKSLGMICILVLNILILGIITLSLYFYLGGAFQGLIIWAVFFAILESILVLLVTVLFSLITNRTLSVLLSLTTYIIGHAITATLVNTFAMRDAVITFLLKTYFTFFPNFSKLNLKDYVLYEQDVSHFNLFGITGYALIYSLLLVIVACFIFNKKNLD